MVLAEAMARGLPIVCTTGGAAAETVPDAAAHQGAAGRRGGAHRRHRAASSTSRACAAAWRDAAWAAGQRLPRWEETARASPASSRRSHHERLRARLARSARARRPSLAQPQAGARARQALRRLAAHHRRRPGLRHRLQPARHRAAAGARAALDAGRPRPGPARGRRRAARPPGPTAPTRQDSAARPVQGRQAHHRGVPPRRPRRATSTARSGPAPISSPPRRCSTSSRPSSSPGFAAAVARAQGGVLHRAHLRRRPALDARARGRRGACSRPSTPTRGATRASAPRPARMRRTR